MTTSNARGFIKFHGHSRSATYSIILALCKVRSSAKKYCHFSIPCCFHDLTITKNNC